jgi:DNA repair protein RecO (recombination protein O)
MGSKEIELIRDEAFLLRSVDYGEDHRILSCLTARHGRTSFIAYSAKKSQKRSFGILDFFNCLKLEIKPHTRGGLSQLVNCELNYSFEKIRQTYLSSMMAFQWIRLIAHVLPEGGNIPGLFELLQEYLNALEKKNDDAWVDLLFRRKILSRFGYHLELSRCIVCQNPNAICFHFTAEKGGLLCDRCDSEKNGLEVGEAFAETLWSLDLEKNPWEEPRRLQAKSILDQSFRFFLEFGNT